MCDVFRLMSLVADFPDYTVVVVSGGVGVAYFIGTKNHVWNTFLFVFFEGGF